MSKHKPILPASKNVLAGKGAVAKQNGLRAFRHGDFASAIKEWRTIDLKADPSVGPALAEAHFRHALDTADGQQRVADLARAVELAPGEGRFWYHLGLAQHGLDRLAEASMAYGRAAALGFKRRPLSFARGLAEIERDPHISVDALTEASSDEAAALLPVAALLRGDAQAVLAPGAGSWFERLRGQARGDAMTMLWRGLAYLAAGQIPQAVEALGARTSATLPGGAETVRLFYNGLALAAAGDLPGAQAQWAKVPDRSRFPRLSAAISSVFARQVITDLQAGRWRAVVQMTEELFALAGSSQGAHTLLTAAIVARNRLANEAVARAAWAEAITYWQQMADLLESAPALGPRGPLLHNVAIANETLEQWEAAAEAWAALMNTLPKRQAKAKAGAAGSPDRLSGLSVVEKRTWLRKRVLMCYQKAGRPDAAITHYRAGVKAAPDDLELRVELAEALLANEQEIAGRNELRRILERDPGHQVASAKLAELHQMRGEWQEAERLYRAALAADPESAVAKRGLAELLRSYGHQQFNNGYYATATDLYASALKLAPDDVELLASIGFVELVQNNEAGARAHFEMALATGVADAYLQVLDRWASHGNVAEFRAIMARAEAAGIASPHFYVDAAAMSFRMARPAELDLFPMPAAPRRPAPKASKAVDPWEESGVALLQKAQAAGGDRLDVCQHAVAALVPVRPNLALPFAERSAALNPDEPMALMMLGLLLAMNERRREAKEALRKATQLARKRGDPGMIAEIESIRNAIDDPFFGMMSRILPTLGGFSREDIF